MRAWRAIMVAASLALPVLLVAGMAGRAEWSLRGGVPVRVRITGYDPRDLIRGHYLRFRFAWNWEGGAAPRGPTSALCVLSRDENPLVRPLASASDPACELELRLQPGDAFRFQPEGVSDQLFVPEGAAAALQTSLLDGSARLTVALSVDRDGTARISDWQVDGVDVARWRR